MLPFAGRLCTLSYPYSEFHPPTYSTSRVYWYWFSIRSMIEHFLLLYSMRPSLEIFVYFSYFVSLLMREGI
ncbi:hypothetical protein BDZ94DRAFT_1249966 [Collybia nuda]|uniref:Uncharacterized protein n=1 Tax=Collybia nuda TaxID=64659 RepID=A0A9P5YCR4_9AGAR|nr:hypothetical protein BDZ94DRAFT_1249966 [Collybia nuda]